jgi:hypothetical protein
MNDLVERVPHVGGRMAPPSLRHRVRGVSGHGVAHALLALAVGVGAGLGFGIPATAAAQAPGASDPVESGRGFFMVGTQRLYVDDLNRSMDAAGYPGFSSSALTLGGGGLGSQGAFLIGGEGHGVLGSDRTTASGDLQTRIGGGYGLFTVGYDLLPDDALSVYPLIGIGAGALSVKIHERGAPLFDDLLENPRRGVEMSRVSFLLMLAVGGDFLVEVPHDGPERGGFAVGLRVGYMASLGQRSWSSDVGNVAGGPDLSPAGPFVRIQIGGGTLP